MTPVPGGGSDTFENGLNPFSASLNKIFHGIYMPVTSGGFELKILMFVLAYGIQAAML